MFLGVHITAGTFPDNATPPILKQFYDEGKTIQFEFTGTLTRFKAMRPRPNNLPGMITFDDGTRFYPTYWIFAGVKWITDGIPTEWKPHISIANIGVKSGQFFPCN